MTKTLFIDIETFPALAYVWGLWDQNISIDKIVQPGGVACWAASWADSDEVYFSSVQLTSKRKMLKELHDLLSEADEVVGYNSNSFDIKHLNGEFWQQGWAPPAPYKKVDLYRVIKNNFKLLSSNMDYALKLRGLQQKNETGGFGLWLECMRGDEAAWNKMEEYNVADVVRTAELWETLRAWIPGSNINRSAALGGHVCPECGSDKLHSRGTQRTTTNVYRRFQCQGCGTWSRSVMPAQKNNKSTMLVKVAR